MAPKASAWLSEATRDRQRQHQRQLIFPCPSVCFPCRISSQSGCLADANMKQYWRGNATLRHLKPSFDPPQNNQTDCLIDIDLDEPCMVADVCDHAGGDDDDVRLNQCRWHLPDAPSTHVPQFWAFAAAHWILGSAPNMCQQQWSWLWAGMIPHELKPPHTNKWYSTRSWQQATSTAFGLPDAIAYAGSQRTKTWPSSHDKWRNSLKACRGEAINSARHG